MFSLEIAAAAATLGVLGAKAWRDGGRSIVAALFVLMLFRALLLSYNRSDLPAARSAAVDWVAAAPPGGISTDDWTRRTLALMPGAKNLPLAETVSNSALLTIGDKQCAGGKILRSARFERREPAPIVWLRRRKLLLGPQVPVWLCLVQPAWRR